MVGNLAGMPRALANIQNVRLMVAAEAWVFVCGRNIRRAAGCRIEVESRYQRKRVRLRYADLRIETYAARSMLYQVARLVTQAERCE